MKSLTVLTDDTAFCCDTGLRPTLDTAAAEALTVELDVLSHPIRLRLLSLLAGRAGPVCVCDLEAAVPVKQPTVSHHLKVLREAGLVDSERKGLWAYYYVRREELEGMRRRITAGLIRLTGGEHE